VQKNLAVGQHAVDVEQYQANSCRALLRRHEGERGKGSSVQGDGFCVRWRF
jgi:hypothetical protein